VLRAELLGRLLAQLVGRLPTSRRGGQAGPPILVRAPDGHANAERHGGCGDGDAVAQHR
jgi:hypothetical protein